MFGPRIIAAPGDPVASNWKVYVDNYLEGYHIPVVHPTPGGRGLRRGGDEGQALYYWVFPNLMPNVYPGNLQTNLIVPLSPERTLARFE
jgi:ring hydroxylating enzyme alpha subunit